MQRIENKHYLILLLMSLFMLNSCHIVRPFFIKNKKKEARKEKREEKKETRKEEKAIKKSDTTELVKKAELKIPDYDTLLARKVITSRNVDYKTFQSKAKMHFESGDQKQNFTANFRLKKGEVIWVTISGFGIEVARALITPDSVKAIERINKNAYVYTYKDIQKLINLEVDFSTLQDLIIGNSVATDGAITDIKELEGLSTIFIKGLDYTNQLTFNKIDSSLKQIQMQTMRSVSTSSLLISLSQYQREGEFYLSTQRTYNIQDVKGAARLEMDINKFDFNKEMDFPFSIPSNYSYTK